MVRAIWYAYCGIATQIILVNGSGRNAMRGGERDAMYERPTELDDLYGELTEDEMRQLSLDESRASHDDSDHRDAMYERPSNLSKNIPESPKKRGTLLSRIGWH
jgi:hypothetical protein